MSLDDLLDDLLFFNKEGTDNTATNAVGTAGTTIGTGDRLLGLGNLREFTGAKCLKLYYLNNIKNSQLITYFFFPIPLLKNINDNNKYVHQEEQHHSHHNEGP